MDFLMMIQGYSISFIFFQYSVLRNMYKVHNDKLSFFTILYKV